MEGESSSIINDTAMDLQIATESMERVSDCNLVILKNVFNNECAKLLAEEVSNLSYSFTINDLHSLSQTKDLSNMSDLPKHISQFLQFVKSPAFRPLLHESFGLDEVHSIQMTASIYKHNDYLLCHDDRVGRRAVAFIYYLTENWESSDGGQLKFFSYDEGEKEPISDSYRKIIVPEFNSMVLFLVSESSFHEVEQIFGTKPRISINGWFHSKSMKHPVLNAPINKDSEAEKLFVKAPLFTFMEPVKDSIGIDILSPDYRESVTWREMAKFLRVKPRIFAHDFLDSTVFEEVAKELRECNNWSLKGPPFRRKYETLDVKSGEGGILVDDEHSVKLNVLLNFLCSTYWLELLCSVTNLDLAVLEEDLVPPTCMVEVQRWKTGCYTVLAAQDIVQEQPSIDVSIFFNANMSEDYQAKAGKASGNIIHILTNTKSMDQKRLEMISLIKKDVALLRSQSIYGKTNNFSRFKDKKEDHCKRFPRHTSLAKKVIRRIHKSVERKMERIKEYRKSRKTDEVEYVVPIDNSIFLTMNSKNTNKYTSFVLKTEQDEDAIMYHCVNVTYLTANSFEDERKN